MVSSRDGKSGKEDEKELAKRKSVSFASVIDSSTAYPSNGGKPIIQCEFLDQKDSTVRPQNDGQGGQGEEERIDADELKATTSWLNGHFGGFFCRQRMERAERGL